MTKIREHQEQLAAVARARYAKTHTFSDRVLDAFFRTPRHQFVSRYRHFGNDRWNEVDLSNPDPHLGAIYADHPLILHGSEKDYEQLRAGAAVSTISQPSLVLWLLDQLDVQAGQTVYELGAGSGWNAALIGRLVGESGRVWSAEILPEVAERARRHLAAAHVDNVEVVEGDGTSFDPARIDPVERFDRVLFTAATFDLPLAFHERVKEGGRLLLVLQVPGGTDVLMLLDKEEDHFTARKLVLTSFVPVTGPRGRVDLAVDLDVLLRERNLGPEPVRRRHFAWGAGGEEHIRWQSAGLRSFLALYADRYVALRETPPHGLFGWWGPGEASLAVATPGELLSFGGGDAADQLVDTLKGWVDLGMPSLPTLRAAVYPAGREPSVGPGEGWIWRRGDSSFVWTLP